MGEEGVSINPDAPIASEQHPELYERMCKARAFIEQVLAAYVKARKANGMTRPTLPDLWMLEEFLDYTIEDELSIANNQCAQVLGEEYQLTDGQLELLTKENWND